MDDKDLLIEQYIKQNAELTALVNTLNETICQLQETIKELQRQLSQDPQNSPRPPSSDGFNKPKPAEAFGRDPAGNRVDKRDIPDLICLSRMNRMRSKSICQRGACPAHI